MIGFTESIVRNIWPLKENEQMGVYYSHYLIPKDNTLRPEPDRIVALIEAWVEKGFLVGQKNVPAQSQNKSGGAVLEFGARFMTKSSQEQVVERQEAHQPRPGFWKRLRGGPQKAIPRPGPWMPFAIPPAGDALTALAESYAAIQWEGHPDATYPMKTATQVMVEGGYSFFHRLSIETSDDFINPETDPYGSAEGDARQVTPICDCGSNLEYNAMSLVTDARIRRICPMCGIAFRPQDQIAEIVDGSTGAKTPQPGGLCNRFGIILDFGKELPLYLPDPKRGLVDITPKVTDIFWETCRSALGIELNEFSYYS
jgi:hypothetical protein